MKFLATTIFATSVLSVALPWGDSNNDNIQLQSLPPVYTLTVFSPSNPSLYGKKLEWDNGAVSIGYSNSSTYCPTIVGIECPNGTQLAFAGTFTPYSEVPGGQDFYVQPQGNLYINPQHEHVIPPGAYAYGEGWNWTALPADVDAFPGHWHANHDGKSADRFSDDDWRRCHEGCPTDDPTYDCSYPSGYWHFKAPDDNKGGLFLCDNPYTASDPKVVFAQTPKFAGTNCERILGLGTHAYTGGYVWAYA